MGWNIFKRHPSAELGEYHVQILNEQMDFDNEFIREIVDNVGTVAETWPNLSLQDFKDLTEEIKQKMAIPTGEIVTIGDAVYLYIDPDTGKDVETGLTWDKASVRSNMENFVIDTVSQIFNDEEVRLNDDVTYSMLNNAFVQLVSAADTLTDIAEGDLPALPTEEEYLEALETNQPLKILPVKLKTSLVSLQTPQQTGETNSNGVPEIRPTEDNPEVNDVMPQIAPTGPAPIVPSPGEVNGYGAKKSEPSEGYDQAPKIITHGNNQLFNELLGRIEQFTVTIKKFEVDSAKLERVVSPEDDDYVDVMMNRERASANTLLEQSSKSIAGAFRTQLMHGTTIHLDHEKLDSLLSKDWQTPIKQRIENDQTKVFADRLAGTQANLDDAYQNDVDQENARHEQTLARLASQLELDKSKAIEQNESMRDQVIHQETTQSLAQQQLYIDKEVETLRKNAEELVRHAVLDGLVSRQEDADHMMANQLQEMVRALEAERRKFVAEHESALEKRQNADEAQLKRVQAEMANQNISMLEEDKKRAEDDRLVLQQQIVKLQGEATKWQGEAESSKSDLERLTARVAELTESSNQTALIAALAGRTQQSDQPVMQKQTNGFVKGMLVSAAVLLGLGGVGYGVYSAQAAKTTSKENIKAVKASYELREKTLKLQPTKAKQTTSTTKATATSSDTRNAQSSTADNNFQSLDNDVNSNSLKVYYQQFENKDLKTENRTLAVGKLLVDSGNMKAAKQLAANNTGHNTQLLTLINTEEVKS